MEEPLDSLSADEGGVSRTPIRIHADPSRVMARFFLPGGQEKAGAILEMVWALPEDEVARLLTEVRERFAERHPDLDAVFSEHYGRAARLIGRHQWLGHDRRLLAGAYFTLEYSFESVSLFNPSMVLHPDQTGLPDGTVRFLMSLRACGEGHVSSLVFRTGTVDDDYGIQIAPPGDHAVSARPAGGERCDKEAFRQGLEAIGVFNGKAQSVLDKLSDAFTLRQLEEAVEELDGGDETIEAMISLARANYYLEFPHEVGLGERVIFPATEHESRGIEDTRFVHFTYEDGRTVYYGTYAAFDGTRTIPRLIETTDFRRFRVATLHGPCVEDKGWALFPRKIDGRYAMVSRLDGKSLYFMQSNSLHFWDQATRIEGPVEPWEYMLIGNCGSPIETREGWLLLTHGVGPMRRYCLGAMLLDRKNPSIVKARLRRPLLVPEDSDRDGYVPNVVYTCGAMRHRGHLFIPYGVSDTSTGIAVVKIPDLLARLAPRD
jgi:predicted GH43/DUF377 family glycosyl hydrolase